MKPKRCKSCRNTFAPSKPMQSCCSVPCAIAYSQKQQLQKEKLKQKAARQEVKRRKDALKTRSDYIKEAQKAVNAWRRAEELAKGRGCISCDRTQQDVMATDGWKPGGAWDAGHYMSVGAMPAKRFDPMNIWLQCKSCNAGSSKYARKGGVVSKQFRENLVAMIGMAAVEELERDDGPAKWTIEDLKAIRDDATRKRKELMA